MTQIIPVIEMFMEPIALAIMLVYLYGMVHRSGGHPRWKTMFMGGIFGFAAVVSMTSPMVLTDGIILDLRNLFIGISAAFFGLAAGLITLAIAAAMRIFLGGSGIAYALPAMMITMTASLVWRHYFWEKQKLPKTALPLLGLMISMHLLVGLFLPEPLRTQYVLTIVPIITAMDIIGAFIMGRLLQREASLVDETERMVRAATIDPLTNIMNRRRLEEVAAGLPMPRHPELGRALIYFDIDRFKAINDTHGHAAGDATLMEICIRIQRCLRPTDHFGRIGGDEFVVILPDVSKLDAQMVSERCREIIARQKMTYGDVQFDVSISLGVNWMHEPLGFAAHLSHADDALYQAKQKGRNCVVYRTCADAAQTNVPKLKAVS